MVLKPDKLQRIKQIYEELCCMVQDSKRSFVLRSYYYTVHHSELREQVVSMR